MPNSSAFHYTNERMVKDLMKLIPFNRADIALDAGSGKNKVWYKNCPVKSWECEIEDKCDFLTWKMKVDWVIGNPPFHISWKFTDRASQIARKGIAWLVNSQGLNSLLTPHRLQIMKDREFELQRIHVVADKRWFGRYYFLIFRKKNKGILTWNTKTY